MLQRMVDPASIDHDCPMLDSLTEELAALEHRQWAHWTKYMLENLTPENIERWKRQCETEYTDLSEKEKNSGREWAEKAMGIMDSFTLADIPTEGLICELSLRPDCQEALQAVRENMR